MKEVFCISGLGADDRIFSKLEIPGMRLRFVKWVQPEPDESIIHYAARMCSQVEAEQPVLAGVSFGGMMAIEMAKQIPCSAVILISSVKTTDEVPGWMRSFGQYGIERILPSRSLASYRALKMVRPVQNYFLGAHTPEEKKIANEFRDKVDPVYLKWAISQVFRWRNTWLPEKVVHVHGARDHIFPIKKIKDAKVIIDGGHFMVMNRYDQISKIISAALAD